ncbi:MAG: hypothetical protein R3A11_08460 [Bdellovibrionota bacterium]
MKQIQSHFRVFILGCILISLMSCKVELGVVEDPQPVDTIPTPVVPQPAFPNPGPEPAPNPRPGTDPVPDPKPFDPSPLPPYPGPKKNLSVLEAVQTFQNFQVYSIKEENQSYAFSDVLENYTGMVSNFSIDLRSQRFQFNFVYYRDATARESVTFIGQYKLNQENIILVANTVRMFDRSGQLVTEDSYVAFKSKFYQYQKIDVLDSMPYVWIREFFHFGKITLSVDEMNYSFEDGLQVKNSKGVNIQLFPSQDEKFYIPKKIGSKNMIRPLWGMMSPEKFIFQVFGDQRDDLNSSSVVDNYYAEPLITWRLDQKQESASIEIDLNESILFLQSTENERFKNIQNKNLIEGLPNLAEIVIEDHGKVIQKFDIQDGPTFSFDFYVKDSKYQFASGILYYKFFVMYLDRSGALIADRELDLYPADADWYRP